MKKFLAVALSGLMIAGLYDPTPVSAQHRVPHAPHNRYRNKGNNDAAAALAIMGVIIAGAAIASSQQRSEPVYYDDYGRPVRRAAPRYRSYDDEPRYVQPRHVYREPAYQQPRRVYREPAYQQPQYRQPQHRAPSAGTSPNFAQPQYRGDDRRQQYREQQAREQERWRANQHKPDPMAPYNSP